MKLNKKTIILTALSIISLFGFIVFLILVADKHIFWLDKFNGVLFSTRNKYLNVVFRAVTAFGSSVVLIAITIILLIFLKDKRVGFGLLGGLSSAIVLNLLIKYIVRRPRPDAALMLVEEAGFSFPSAHAMLSIVFYGLLIYFIFKHTNKKWVKILSAILFSLIVIVVGFSRIYLGVHYTSDVLAGFLLGWFVLCISLFVINSIKTKNNSNS